MSLDSAYRKAWGRPPTPLESERLKRLQDAFQVGENDAFLTIAAVLEFYDTMYRQYPDKCAEAANRAIKECLLGSELLRAPTPGLMAPASGRPPPAPLFPGEASVDGRRELYWVTLGGLATTFLALFGAVCFAAGAAMQAGGRPFWTRGSSDVLSVSLATVLGAPAGWIVLLALLVPGLYAAAWGWCRGRDASKAQRERLVGWGTLTAVCLGLLGWLILLRRLPQDG